MTTARKTRKIPGTPYVAETVYKSGDGSVHTVRLATNDGKHLGYVSFHSACGGWRSRGYHEGQGVYGYRLRSWDTLAKAAIALDKEV